MNPDGQHAPGLLEILRWKLTTRPQRSPAFINDVEPSVPPPHPGGRGIRVTLINHSTVLIQQENLNILTDPVWSDRVSPFSWIGPKRRRMPGVRWQDLPPVHIVLLSHNHFDHLDLPTIRRLAADHQPEFVVPRGVGRFLETQGIKPVREMDWGESGGVRGIAVHCVPATHFSGRGVADRNRTLWCGYVIESRAGNIYFAGDTAFGSHFAAIRKRFGDPVLACLPIGAYLPRWVMSRVHMNPEEALRAHNILCARTSIGIHHGTFQLADDGLDAAAADLKFRVMRSTNLHPFVVLKNGGALPLE